MYYTWAHSNFRLGLFRHVSDSYGVFEIVSLFEAAGLIGAVLSALKVALRQKKIVSLMTFFQILVKYGA